MTTELTLNVRAFPVKLRDQRTGQHSSDLIVLDKQQLKAAEDCGLKPEDLIHFRYQEQGYKVLEIGKAIRRTIPLDLKELYKAHCLTGKREVAV